MVTDATDQRKCFRRKGTEVEDIAYCEFYYSFCHALPDDICPSITRTADIKPSVCQKVYYNDGSSIEYDMGKFSTEHEYHPTSKFMKVYMCVCEDGKYDGENSVAIVIGVQCDIKSFAIISSYSLLLASGSTHQHLSQVEGL